MTQPLIETPRLALRPLVSADLDFITELMSDRLVAVMFGRPFTRDDCRAWIDRQAERYREYGAGYWLVSERETGAPVGQAGVLPAEIVPGEPGEPALGYILHERYRGRGYATEAAAASCDWAFRRLRPERVVTLVRPENFPSVRVAERLYLRRVTHVMFGGYEHILFARYRADHVPEGWA